MAQSGADRNPAAESFMRDFLSFELPGGTYMQRLEALVAENKCRLVSAAVAAARARCGHGLSAAPAVRAQTLVWRCGAVRGSARAAALSPVLHTSH